MSYKAPTEDLSFLLHHVFAVTRSDIPGYAELDPALTGAVLEEAGKLAEESLAPLNAVGDKQGCVLENGVVRTPKGFAAAFARLGRDGWIGLDCDPAYGGQGLPYLMGTAVGEILVGANMALNMYQGLTHGAYSAIHTHGTAEQKALYLPRLVSGEWSGTMNLTEPQCGTDLGLIRTRAEAQPDGTWRITGQKIFISAGDHDMAANIIHLVLARAPGGGEGTRGLSLFIVPKFTVGADGAVGGPNGVVTRRIEAKMGIHGNATCELAYDGARGVLLGELHRGMKAMFTMMNEARIGVGVQGYALAGAAYAHAAAYAGDRLQGRAVTGAVQPAAAADPLIVHPDVRRMLMDQRAFVEGARAFALWGAELIDRAQRMGDAGAEGLASLLTPVIKGFLTDRGFDACVAAQQVWGGHGYIEDNPMSQFTRDARIAMIYEGANGVQALDLVGRKLGSDGGKAFMALASALTAEVTSASADPRLAVFASGLDAGAADLQAAAGWFLEHGMKAPDAALAGSHDFLHLMGHVCLGLMWSRMARAAQTALDEGRGDAAFLRAKLITGQHWMARHMPATALHLARIKTGAETVMALPAAAF